MDDKSPAIALYCSLVRGSATKTKLRKSTRFTDEQEALMENCFDMGETEKKNRYAAQSCKQLMEERLGKEMELTEQHIKSYWSAYKRKKSKKAIKLNRSVPTLKQLQVV